MGLLNRHGADLKAIKKLLCETFIRALPDFSNPIEVECDVAVLAVVLFLNQKKYLLRISVKIQILQTNIEFKIHLCQIQLYYQFTQLHFIILVKIDNYMLQCKYVLCYKSNKVHKIQLRVMFTGNKHILQLRDHTHAFIRLLKLFFQ